MRVRHMSRRTVTAYVAWIKRFISFHGLRHPNEMGAEEVTAFLTHLAVVRKVSASTQNQALAALLFLYRTVLGVDLPWLDDVIHAKRPVRIPTVLSRHEVRQPLEELDGVPALVATLLYGGGLRLLECLRVRIKDIDFARSELTVRRGKGAKDRRTILPAAVAPALGDQVERVRAQHRRDLSQGAGFVEIPGAFARKSPNAATDWAW